MFAGTDTPSKVAASTGLRRISSASDIRLGSTSLHSCPLLCAAAARVGCVSSKSSLPCSSSDVVCDERDCCDERVCSPADHLRCSNVGNGTCARGLSAMRRDSLIALEVMHGQSQTTPSSSPKMRANRRSSLAGHEWAANSMHTFKTVKETKEDDVPALEVIKLVEMQQPCKIVATGHMFSFPQMTETLSLRLEHTEPDEHCISAATTRASSSNFNILSTSPSRTISTRSLLRANSSDFPFPKGTAEDVEAGPPPLCGCAEPKPRDGTSANCISITDADVDECMLQWKRSHNPKLKPTSSLKHRTHAHESLNWMSMRFTPPSSSEHLLTPSWLPHHRSSSMPSMSSPSQSKSPRGRASRQLWPGRDESEFKRGKALLKTVELDPLTFSPDNLVHLALEMFIDLDLLHLLHLPVEKVQRFILAVRDRMYDNPYHNFYHVFDVTQTTYVLGLTTGLIASLTPMEKFALMVAALCHDLEHPGVNNMLLIREDAVSQFRDKVNLEKHHSLRTFELLVDDDIDLLHGLNTNMYYQFRDCVMKLILATDMSKHPQYIQRVAEAKSTFKEDLLSPMESPAACSRKQGSVMDRDKAVRLGMEVLIKCADISNVIKPFGTAKKWAYRVTEEFFKQGDVEKSWGMEVSKTCDRGTNTRVGLQRGFIDFLALPFFENISELFPSLDSHVQLMKVNRKLWDEYDDEALEKDCGNYREEQKWREFADDLREALAETEDEMERMKALQRDRSKSKSKTFDFIRVPSQET